MKRKISLKIVVLIGLFAALNFAQEVAPLALGNTWIWEHWEWQTIEKTIVVDTGYVINGKEYFVIDLYGDSSAFDYVRYNSDDSLYYMYQKNGFLMGTELPYYKNKCKVGDTISYQTHPNANFTKSVESVFDSAMVFDTLITMKFLHYRGLVEGDEIWTDEFGMLYRDNAGEVKYWLRGCIINGVTHGDTIIYSVNEDEILVHDFKLYQNYPNPFNPKTRIKYKINKPTNVKLVVYDLLGKEVAVLVEEEKTTGNYTAIFNGEGFASGIYFYQLNSGGKTETKKMILLH